MTSAAGSMPPSVPASVPPQPKREVASEKVRTGAINAARVALEAARERRSVAGANGAGSVSVAFAPTGVSAPPASPAAAPPGGGPAGGVRPPAPGFPPPAKTPRPAFALPLGKRKVASPNAQPIPGAPPAIDPATRGAIPVGPSPLGASQPVAANTNATLDGEQRRVRLTVARIDPWSVMKIAFLLAVAAGIMIVVAAAVFWFAVDGLGTFDTIQSFINQVVGAQANIDLSEFLAFDRVISFATLVAILNILLMTAIATIVALLYNITAALVGGIHVTLTDD